MRLVGMKRLVTRFAWWQNRPRGVERGRDKRRKPSEEVYVHDYITVQDAIERLPRFLEEVYIRKRLHSALDYRPPEEYKALRARTAA